MFTPQDGWDHHDFVLKEVMPRNRCQPANTLASNTPRASVFVFEV